MGQYRIVVNIDKKQYLHPHKFGSGLKQMEYTSDGGAGSLLQGLALLMSDSHSRGGGDFHGDLNGLYGTWAGDRIIHTGDYADKVDGEESLYNIAQEQYEDISHKVLIGMIEGDRWVKENMYAYYKKRGNFGMFSENEEMWAKVFEKEIKLDEPTTELLDFIKIKYELGYSEKPKFRTLNGAKKAVPDYTFKAWVNEYKSR